jgi:Cu/Ag efflux protein CusF/uncharacterized cupredoxin-like copper-binding protein
MFVIEPNRPRNNFRHLVPGAGRIPDLARATAERYQREYSLVYMDVDDRLNAIPATGDDPRAIEKAMHREYDATQRRPNVFLLNGRSFPFTLRDTPILVQSGEHVLLRVLNAGARALSVHTHGHHPMLMAVDGTPLPPAARITRDVFTVTAAQRVDLDLYAGDDGRRASGPGVWLVHDHSEQATTNNGINPGGDLTTIVYEGFLGSDGLPRVATSLKRFFDPDFYRGKVPVFDPAIFHAAHEGREAAPAEHGAAREEHHVAHDEHRTARAADDEAAAKPYPVRRETPGTNRPSLEEHELAEHRVAAHACAEPRGHRRVVLKEGTHEAKTGDVYGFEPRVIHAERCEEVEIVLENTDAVRHAFMIPALDPMFMLEFTGPGTRIGRFVTPDADVTLDFHCHVPGHEKTGMRGEMVVGKGGTPDEETAEAEGELYEGEGVIVSVDPRKSRVVLNHKEIPGFMAPMTNMSFLVTDPALLTGLRAGEGVRFTIDAEQRAIVKIGPLAPR